MKKETITGKINRKALELLEDNPNGVHWSELILAIRTSDPTLHPKTINGCIWKLVEKFPEQVYKPQKGVFRLLKYKESL